MKPCRNLDVIDKQLHLSFNALALRQFCEVIYYDEWEDIASEVLHKLK